MAQCPHGIKRRLFANPSKASRSGGLADEIGAEADIPFLMSGFGAKAVMSHEGRASRLLATTGHSGLRVRRCPRRGFGRLLWLVFPDDQASRCIGIHLVAALARQAIMDCEPWYFALSTNVAIHIAFRFRRPIECPDIDPDAFGK